MAESATPPFDCLVQGKLIGLSESTLASLQRIFSPTLEVKKVILFGSRAKGNFREGSDIDLALDAQHLSFSALLALKVALDDSSIPQRVDLCWLHELTNQELVDHIERVGIPLFVRRLRNSSS